MRRACRSYAQALVQTHVLSPRYTAHRELSTAVGSTAWQPLPPAVGADRLSSPFRNDVSATARADKRGIVEESGASRLTVQPRTAESLNAGARSAPVVSKHYESDGNIARETSEEEERRMTEEAVWQTIRNNDPDDLSSQVVTDTGRLLADNMTWLRFCDPAITKSFDSFLSSQEDATSSHRNKSIGMETIPADEIQRYVLTTEESYILERRDWATLRLGRHGYSARFPSSKFYRDQIANEQVEKYTHQTWASWLPKYLGISMRFNTIYSPAMRNQAVLRVDERAEGWAQQLGFTQTDPAVIEHVWRRLDPDEQRSMWPDAMLWLMWHRPQSVPVALMATYDLAVIPKKVYMDIAKYLAEVWWTASEQTEGGSEEAKEQVDYILQLLSAQNRARIPRKLIWLLLRQCNLEQLRAVQQLTRGKLDPMTMLHLAQRFGKFGNFEAAMHEIRWCITQGLNKDDKHLLMVLTSILRNSMINPIGYHANAWIMQQIVSMGIAIDIKQQTALMTNAIDAGDAVTATRMFRLAQSRDQLQLDNYAYSTVARAARKAKDYDLLREIIQLALQSGQMNDWLASEILIGFLTLLKSSKGLTNGYKRQETVRVYCELFNPELLLQLEIITGSEVPNPEHCANRQPSFNTITAVLCMLWYQGAPSPAMIRKVWMAFRARLLDSGDHNIHRNVFAGLTTSDHFSNIILMAARRHSELLEFSTEVVRDMAMIPEELHYTAVENDNGDVRRSRSTNLEIEPVRPTARTWTILMAAFTRHNQIRAAQKVLDLMRAKGEEPDEVTWHTLVNGLIRTGDNQEIADVMRQQISDAGGPETPPTERLLEKVGHLDTVQSLMAEYTPLMPSPGSRPEDKLEGEMDNFQEVWQPALEDDEDPTTTQDNDLCTRL